MEPSNELDFGNNINPKKSSTAKKEKKTPADSKPVVKLSRRPITDYLFCDPTSYTFKTWRDAFPEKQVRLRSLVVNPYWDEFFDIVEKKKYFKNMEKILSGYMSEKKTILPVAELIFNSLNILSPEKIKVVFLGQDPYHGVAEINGKNIPQAIGCSFSVPVNYPKPPSLTNIYENLLQFEHIKEKPNGGCLSGWILQGCFMINAAFTVFYKQPNSHASTWTEFTGDLIKYINNKCNNVVFLAWGKHAHMLCHNVDPSKHCIITSSHPSPYACGDSYTGFQYGIGVQNRKKITYPPFKTVDHFGRTNEYLRSVNKCEIYWDLVDVDWGQFY